MQVFCFFSGGSFQDGRVEIKCVKLPFDRLCQFPSFNSVRWISRRASCHQPLPDPVSKRKKRNGATLEAAPRRRSLSFLFVSTNAPCEMILAARMKCERFPQRVTDVRPSR